MPPKLDLGSIKLFINGQELSCPLDWGENPLLVPDDQHGEFEEIYEMAKKPIRFSGTITIKRRSRIKLLKEVGLLKRPKLTYRTNRFWKNNKHQ